MANISSCGCHALTFSAILAFFAFDWSVYRHICEHLDDKASVNINHLEHGTEFDDDILSVFGVARL